MYPFIYTYTKKCIQSTQVFIGKKTIIFQFTLQNVSAKKQIPGWKINSKKKYKYS